MTKPIKFFVPGTPQALKRHRMFRRGTHVGSFDPSKGDKADFLSMVMQERPKTPITGPISIIMRFVFPRPKSHYGTGKNSTKLKHDAPFWHTSKPDTDNLQKFVLDALNGVFWVDDSRVCEVIASKVYTSDVGIGAYLGPGVDVEINELNPSNTER